MWFNIDTRRHKKAPKSQNISVGPEKFNQILELLFYTYIWERVGKYTCVMFELLSDRYLANILNIQSKNCDHIISLGYTNCPLARCSFFILRETQNKPTPAYIIDSICSLFWHPKENFPGIFKHQNHWLTLVHIKLMNIGAEPFKLITIIVTISVKSLSYQKERFQA